MTKTKECDKGYKGDCCCNCNNQIELFKHPCNKVHKGSVLESTGMYACITILDEKDKYKGILDESNHGMCEMHTPRQ